MRAGTSKALRTSVLFESDQNWSERDVSQVEMNIVGFQKQQTSHEDVLNQISGLNS